FPLAGYAGDGGPVVLAQFDRPTSIVFGDEPGELYVSDRMNQVVRRIDEGTIASVVGTPQVAGYAGDGGPAAEALLNAPPDTLWDPASRIDRAGERLVIADTGNGVVREVDLATGTIVTLSDAFTAPHDVEIAPDGTVYVADIADGCVRAIDPDGGVTDVVGTCGELGTFVDGVDARDARFEVLAGIDLSPDGDLYLADAWNHVIVRVRGI
ncbi:MAG TPA: hypothetical protein VFV33_02910, partial [Gemmatimonadaceae bacterium]|nr:hypothetical protein [Gemmatimonadaceae bacterium]